MTETNIGLAADFFGKMGAGDLAGAMALAADDFTWKVVGKKGGPFLLAGTYTRDEVPGMFAHVGASIPAGPQIEVLTVTETADHAYIEAHVIGQSADGVAYDNYVLFAIDIVGGKIAAAREFLDTIHAAEVFTR